MDTTDCAFSLRQLVPWIKEGLVVLIPDPGDFDHPLRVKTWDLATKGLAGTRPSADSSGSGDAANEEVTAVHGGEELFSVTWPAFVNLFEDELGILDCLGESELLTGAEARATTPRNLQLRS